MAYVYKGTKPGWGDEQPKPDLKPCGTNAAYNRHIRYGEKACQPCKDAHADHTRAFRPRTRQPAPCGTATAYRRHYARGEKPCQECVAANSEYKNQWRRKKRNPNGLGMNR
jgi:hypothetical protein